MTRCRESTIGNSHGLFKEAQSQEKVDQSVILRNDFISEKKGSQDSFKLLIRLGTSPHTRMTSFLCLLYTLKVKGRCSLCTTEMMTTSLIREKKMSVIPYWTPYGMDSFVHLCLEVPNGIFKSSHLWNVVRL